VKKFVEDYDFVVIDCPPAVDSPVPQSALLIADVALVPIIPSPPDMWASVGIRTLISGLADLNEALKSRIVFNQFQPNTTLSREVMELIPEFEMKVCDTPVRHRQVYRQSAVYGKTVHDFGAKADDAVAEIESLTDEILALL
jgi:chromosome partitioning protein